MAKELITATASGSSLYAHAMSSAAYRWNGAAFEVYNSSNYPDYTILMTEQGSSGVYVGDFPAAITQAGAYDIIFYRVAGGSPLEGDPVCGNTLITV